ncbi:hypothetical protein ACL7TT_13620 [Microbulbifer sp. 2304DJ12-6]|uniref:hypothetical protein n=1 Tax=Microbulbifer sp. 2304DJ12-6 TaxID=3233340 RepID=UPI0039AED3D4
MFGLKWSTNQIHRRQSGADVSFKTGTTVVGDISNKGALKPENAFQYLESLIYLKNQEVNTDSLAYKNSTNQSKTDNHYWQLVISQMEGIGLPTAHYLTRSKHIFDQLVNRSIYLSNTRKRRVYVFSVLVNHPKAN